MPADPRRIKDLFVAALDLTTHRSGRRFSITSAAPIPSCANGSTQS